MVLLLLRTLALLFLILGLARPVFRGSGSVPRKLAAVVDNSASMRAVDAAGRTRLSRALAVAAALVEAGGADLTLAVPTVDDVRAALPDTYGTEPAPLRAALETVAETSAAGRPSEAARRAVAAGAAVPGLAEIHLLTDGAAPNAAERRPSAAQVASSSRDRARGPRRAAVLRRIAPRDRPPPTRVVRRHRRRHSDAPPQKRRWSAGRRRRMARRAQDPGGGTESFPPLPPPAGRIGVGAVRGRRAGLTRGVEVAVLPPPRVVCGGRRRPPSPRAPIRSRRPLSGPVHSARLPRGGTDPRG